MVIIILSSYSIKRFVYNTTFHIAKNPAQDHRTVPQLLGRLVSKERVQNITLCIIHNYDCNFNASKNSNVWVSFESFTINKRQVYLKLHMQTYCCAQPPGCGDRTMFDKQGEWSWKQQYERNQVPEECSY